MHKKPDKKPEKRLDKTKNAASRSKPRAAIVGLGRFGKTLYRLLKDDFALTLFDTNDKVTGSLEEVYECPTVFYCVPIPAFEKVLREHRKYFKSNLLIDVLSVKLHAESVFKKYLKGTSARALLTHPMFGPDSSKNGFAGLPIVMNQFMATKGEYLWWRRYFQKKGLRTVELTPDEHDKLTANSQAVTHFIARLLDEMNFGETPIDTMGAKKLREVQTQVGHNTWELFVGLQNYNPYAEKMRGRFLKAFNALAKKLDAGKKRPGEKKHK